MQPDLSFLGFDKIVFGWVLEKKYLLQTLFDSIGCGLLYNQGVWIGLQLARVKIFLLVTKQNLPFDMFTVTTHSLWVEMLYLEYGVVNMDT